MNDFTRVNLFGDLELAVSKKQHRALLIYRVLQKMNRCASGNGCFVMKDARETVAEKLGLSTETIRRIFVAGNGTWWHIENEALILIGHKKLARHFGVVEGRVPIKMRLVCLAGGLANFRQVILSMHVLSLQREKQKPEGISISRKKLAKKAGTSEATLRRHAKWLEVIPQVEIVGKVKGSEGPIAMSELPEWTQRGFRLWEAEDGSTLVVKQRHNLYRSRLGGHVPSPSLQYTPDIMTHGPIEFGEAYACLEQTDLLPVGATVYTASLVAVQTMPQKIAVPPGWSAMPKRGQEFAWVS